MNNAFITIIGNLTKDAEQASTPNGKTVTKLNVAVNTGYGDKKHTDYYNVVYWLNVPQFLLENLKKGRQVVVNGTLQLVTNEYNGKNYQKLTINANSVMADSNKSATEDRTPRQEEIPF